MIGAIFCAATVLLQGGSLAPQGGQAGGGFGGRGLNVDDDFQTVTHILTPGDRGEWPIDAKAGDVVILRASSDVFDPAIEIVDEAGKVVATNDDIKAGVQDAQVLYRFDKPGKYQGLVKGFKSVAGGKYQLMSRRFKALAADVNKPFQANLDEKGQAWVYVHLNEGKTVAVTNSAFKQAMGVSYATPDGTISSFDQSSHGVGMARGAFVPPVTGDYYFKLTNRLAGLPFKFIAAVARPMTTSIDKKNSPQTLDQGAMDEWTFDAKKGDVVQFGVGGNPLYFDWDFRTVPSSGTEDREKFAYLPSGEPEKIGRKILVVEDGSFKLSVNHFGDKALPYELSVVKADKTWTDGKALDESMTISNNSVWSFEGKAGQILHFEGKSNGFVMGMRVISPSGSEYLNSTTGFRNLQLSETFSLGQSGKYVVVVSSLGDGGSGSFHLERAEVPARVMKPGDWHEGNLTSKDKGLWTFEAKKGHLGVLRIQAPTIETSVLIIGPDGKIVGQGAPVDASNAVVINLNVPQDGKYTIWVTCDSLEGGAYKIKWVDLDQ